MDAIILSKVKIIRFDEYNETFYDDQQPVTATVELTREQVEAAMEKLSAEDLRKDKGR